MRILSFLSVAIFAVVLKETSAAAVSIPVNNLVSRADQTPLETCIQKKGNGQNPFLRANGTECTCQDDGSIICVKAPPPTETPLETCIRKKGNGQNPFLRANGTECTCQNDGSIICVKAPPPTETPLETCIRKKAPPPTETPLEICIRKKGNGKNPFLRANGTECNRQNTYTKDGGKICTCQQDGATICVNTPSLGLVYPGPLRSARRLHISQLLAVALHSRKKFKLLPQLRRQTTPQLQKIRQTQIISKVFACGIAAEPKRISKFTLRPSLTKAHLYVLASMGKSDKQLMESITGLSTAIWSVSEPTYLLQDFAPSIGIGKITENKDLGILGQYPYYMGDKREMCGIHIKSAEETKRAGISDKLKEVTTISAQTITHLCIVINLKEMILELPTAKIRDLRRNFLKLIKAEITSLRGLASFIEKKQAKPLNAEAALRAQSRALANLSTWASIVVFTVPALQSLKLWKIQLTT
ncbi:hypothetical protein BB561_001318 [Smittium simulii]|uniref:Uncharacterized protein n=1 Tax=Smittium simulii TaxID=133385 RepID=A0A2T9YV55_9FUNG|nr:hypothetical protein BB561_001318 [Smittium simulii]